MTSNVREQIFEIFRTSGPGGKYEGVISIERISYDPSCVKIVVDLNVVNDVFFEHLEKLSKILDTKRINLSDYEHYGGCETCDHGSTKTVTVYCRNVSGEISVTK